MFRVRLLHPGILGALGEAGHGSKVLIADGSFPLSTHSNPGPPGVTNLLLTIGVLLG
jgi:L-fucose mutarotase